MSRVNHLSNGKSIMILGTVVGCLSLLWPKVFYPMIQGGFQTDNPDANAKEKIHPRMKAPGTTPNNHQSSFHGPSTPYQRNEQSSVGASVGIIMTVYTAGIIFLFIYTIFKYMSADNSLDNMEECDQQQLVEKSFEDSKAKEKKGKPSFDEYNHEQGECLKGLALNYVQCKQKLEPAEKKTPTTEDDVSEAYRVLLSDMLELRDYLLEPQCTDCCQECESQCPDCEICRNECEANESKLSTSTLSKSDIDENPDIHDENEHCYSEQTQNLNDDSEDEGQTEKSDESDSDGDNCQTDEEDVEE